MAGATTRRTTRSTRLLDQNAGQKPKHPAPAPPDKDKTSTVKASTSQSTKSATTAAPAATAPDRKRKALGDHTNAEKKKKAMDKPKGQEKEKAKEFPKRSVVHTSGTSGTASSSMRMVVELPLRKRRVALKSQAKAETAVTIAAKSSKLAVGIESATSQNTAHVNEALEPTTRSKPSRPPNSSFEPSSKIRSTAIPKVEKVRTSKPPRPKAKTIMVEDDEHPSKRRRSNDRVAVPLEMPSVVEASHVVPAAEDGNPFEAGLRSKEKEQMGIGTIQRWDNLDEEDANDPLMVAEYVVEIFEYMKELEVRTMPSSAYMNSQPELDWSMRGILMDWLIQVHARFKLIPETLFLATNIIDRFLSLRIVSLIKLQLVGITALFVASKYEEIMAPSVAHFLQVSDSEYTEQEILGAEKYMLRTLNWDLSYPNPMSWLRRASKADAYDVQTRTLAKFLVEISIVEYRLLRFAPSMLAAAALWLARLILDREEWDANLEHYSGYVERKIIPCANVMLNYIMQPKMVHDSIWKKYSGKKYYRCAMYARKWAEQRWPPESRGSSGGNNEEYAEVEVDLVAALPVLREQIKIRLAEDIVAAAAA